MFGLDWQRVYPRKTASDGTPQWQNCSSKEYAEMRSWEYDVRAYKSSTSSVFHIHLGKGFMPEHQEHLHLLIQSVEIFTKDCTSNFLLERSQIARVKMHLDCNVPLIKHYVTRLLLKKMSHWLTTLYCSEHYHLTNMVGDDDDAECLDIHCMN